MSKKVSQAHEQLPLSQAADLLLSEARMILTNTLFAALIAVTLFALFFIFWFVLPRTKILESFLGGEE